MSLAQSFHELREHLDSSDDAIAKTADQRREDRSPARTGATEGGLPRGRAPDPG